MLCVGTREPKQKKPVFNGFIIRRGSRETLLVVKSRMADEPDVCIIFQPRVASASELPECFVILVLRVVKTLGRCVRCRSYPNGVPLALR